MGAPGTLANRCRGTAASALASVMAACGGGGSGTDTQPAAVDITRSRLAAATATANSASNACAGIGPFYWELGDRNGLQGSASVNRGAATNVYDANTAMPIASASKWLYGAYVAQKRAGMLSEDDVRYLSFRSGYTSFGISGCSSALGETVGTCQSRPPNGDFNASDYGRFYYNGGHMQKHATLPGMDLGPLDNAGLATEMQRLLGNDISIEYTQPQLAGGVRSTAASYARFLRKLLRNDLAMTALLGGHPVCTNPASCRDAISTPTPPDLSWHYSIGHWVEDDPVSGDGAFSSAGAFGFYPWVSADKSLYGIVARRVVDAGAGAESAACGRLIRKAWVTGVAQ